jgi:hypothetical protein
MKTGIFFNMFRNGDSFIVREFVREIIQKCPEYNWHYAHGNHPDSLKDLPCNYISIPHHPDVCNSTGCETHEVSHLLPRHKMLLPHETIRRLSPESNLYINTWTGCYHGHFFPVGHYANMHELIRIWQHIGQKLSPILNKSILFDKPIVEYFPVVNESMFDVSIAENFVKQLHNEGYKHCILWANGDSLSNQSKLQSLNHTLVMMAKEFPRVAMIATAPFERTMKNLYFTQEIFGKKFDLPQISVLSAHCNIIVGKNSGPYTFANTKKNVLDSNKTFISFSNAARDNLLFDIHEGCHFYHSDAVDQDTATNFVRDIINSKCNV